MTDKKPERSLPERSLEERGSDLSKRLRDARSKEQGGNRKEPKLKSETSGLGQALRIGVDMVSAVVVGVGIGWWLDKVLGTKPWLMIIFILLGGAAGILNAYRTAMRMTEDLNETKPSDAMNENDAAKPDDFAQKK